MFSTLHYECFIRLLENPVCTHTCTQMYQHTHTRAQKKKTYTDLSINLHTDTHIYLYTYTRKDLSIYLHKHIHRSIYTLSYRSIYTFAHKYIFTHTQSIYTHAHIIIIKESSKNINNWSKTSYFFYTRWSTFSTIFKRRSIFSISLFTCLWSYEINEFTSKTQVKIIEILKYLHAYAIVLRTSCTLSILYI